MREGGGEREAGVRERDRGEGEVGVREIDRGDRGGSEGGALSDLSPYY